MFNNHTMKEPCLIIVGDYLFDPQIGSISGPTGAHHICPRLATLLGCLVRHSNEIIERDLLIELLWPEGNGSSASLSQSISQLRHYLGDSARSAQYIETIPNGGYRLVAPIYGSTVKPQTINTVALVPVSPKKNSLVALFNEFRERKVCRSMLIYMLVIWLVFQISEIVVPAVGLPAWVNSLIVVLGILGFPIAAVLSWIFDITPSGLARENRRAGTTTSGSSRNNIDFVFDSALVMTSLIICGVLIEASLG